MLLKCGGIIGAPMAPPAGGGPCAVAVRVGCGGCCCGGCDGWGGCGVAGESERSAPPDVGVPFCGGSCTCGCCCCGCRPRLPPSLQLATSVNISFKMIKVLKPVSHKDNSFSLVLLFFWADESLKIFGGQRMKTSTLLIHTSGFPN